MKIKSNHVVTVTTEELAERLGFAGTVKSFKFDAGDVVLGVEGDALPSAPAVIALPASPTPTPAPAPALAASTEDRRTLTVEFTTTGDFVALVAYADELKREIEMMLARVPEPGVTATVTVR